MSDGTIRFSKLLEHRILSDISKKFTGRLMDQVALREIRDCIREHVYGVFEKSTLHLSRESLSWVANQFFRNVSIGTGGTTQKMHEMVVINDHPLEEMPLSDLQTLRSIFNETKMGPLLDEEFSKRGLS